MLRQLDKDLAEINRRLRDHGDEAGRRWNAGRATNIPAPLEPGRDGRAARSTNIRLRWSRDEMEGAARSTNIRLRWSREEMEWLGCSLENG